MKTTLLCVLIAALSAACLQRADRAPPASDTSAVPNSTATPAAPAPAAAPTLPPPPGATKLTVVEGFLTPESVLHDPVQDIYFVSNINGGPTTKDNNGFISRVRPDGAVENLKFIEGGHGGVTLNAPSVIAKGACGFDGVEMAGSRMLVSSWSDSTVSSYETGQEVKVITGVPSPADIGYDGKRKRVLVPIFSGNRVEIWQLP